jgi:hypothetical protein
MAAIWQMQREVEGVGGEERARISWRVHQEYVGSEAETLVLCFAGSPSGPKMRSFMRNVHVLYSQNSNLCSMPNRIRPAYTSTRVHVISGTQIMKLPWVPEVLGPYAALTWQSCGWGPPA